MMPLRIRGSIAFAAVVSLLEDMRAAAADRDRATATIAIALTSDPAPIAHLGIRERAGPPRGVVPPAVLRRLEQRSKHRRR